MMITTAILEFLVIGSLWIGVLLVALGLVCFSAPASLPLPDSADLRIFLSLVSLPLAYLVGVIAQGITWRSWYLKRYHFPALERELKGAQAPSYQAIYRAMRKRRYPLPGIARANRELVDGRQLGVVLDLLRMELLNGDRAEIGRQYQVQFHLYRLLYGSIPAMFALALLLSAAALLESYHGGRSLAIYILGSSVCLLAGSLAIRAAAHRRERLWKYLRLGANLIFIPELANALEEFEQSAGRGQAEASHSSELREYGT